MTTTLLPPSRPAARRAPGRSPRPTVHARTLPRGLLVEFALVLAGVVAYFTARGLTEADPSVAVRNAHDVLAVERALGLAHEATLQRYAVGHDWLVDVVNWIYVWGHWPVITVVLLWTWRRHPSAYVVLRNALLVSGLIGVVIFIAFPVAPPRLADLGLLDTVTERSHAYRVLQPPAFVNQYAAIPSLHVGWDLLIGITVVRCSRRVAVRAVGVLLPVAMAISVVLSANHYVVDGVLGALVALVGLALARHLHRRAGRELPSGAVDMAAAETRADGTDGHHGPSTRSCLVEGVPDVTCGPTGRTLDPGRGP